MKRFLSAFYFMFFCLICRCYAVKPLTVLPHLNLSKIGSVEECNSCFEEEKVDFINSLIKRVWNEDFGKFTSLFYKNYCGIYPRRMLEFETLPFTEDTISTTELLMKFLCTSSTDKCLDLFRCWVEFYKNFRCTHEKKEIIFDSLKEFVCRFLVEISKSFFITTELLRERTSIMCELYELEDKKMFLL